MIIHSYLLNGFLNQEIPLEKALEITRKQITEVEGVKVYHNDLLVVGHVLDVFSHPNSDHLHIANVLVGENVKQIVCGAPNLLAGQYVIVALEGCVLSKEITIKKSKIRDVESSGMICSLKEIGFEDTFIPDKFKDGIFYFDSEVEVGSSAYKALGLEGYSLDIKPASNRPDLLSVYGFVKDFASCLGITSYIPKYDIPEVTSPKKIKIEVTSETCLNYNAIILKNCVIKESPIWLKAMLIASNIRPINNVVDISNYCMIVYGTPLHTFDLDTFSTKKIVVRNALNDEKVVTLDKVERVLNTTDCVITDGTKVLAIAGIMGLSNSIISEKTKNVLLEAALFDKNKIKDTSKRLNLSSESSLRFVKGLEKERVVKGLKLAVNLLIELADGVVSSPLSSVGSSELELKEIRVNMDKCNSFLGTKLEQEEFENILFKLDYGVIKDLGNSYIITIPEFRLDLDNENDIYEEIARQYGFDNIPLQELEFSPHGGLTLRQKRERLIKDYLVDNGLFEVISYSLLKESEVRGFHQIGEIVRVEKPLNDDRVYLRQSLIPGLLSTFIYNTNRKVANVNIFEIGKVFEASSERKNLGILLSGVIINNLVNKISIPVDFFYLKGIIEGLFNKLNFKLKFETSDYSYFHPFQQANIYFEGEIIGQIGKLLFQEANLYALEINLDCLLVEKKIKYSVVSKVPTMERDISFVIDEEIESGKIIDLIKQTAKDLLKEVYVFDVFKGNSIGEKKKSMAIHMVFQRETNLLSEEIDNVMKKIVNRLDHNFKATIRV